MIEAVWSKIYIETNEVVYRKLVTSEPFDNTSQEVFTIGEVAWPLSPS